MGVGGSPEGAVVEVVGEDVDDLLVDEFGVHGLNYN